MDKNFDWKTYINNYEDLRKAGINTREKAWVHWEMHGKSEGRSYANIHELKQNVVSDNLIDTNNFKKILNNYEELKNVEFNNRAQTLEYWEINGQINILEYTKNNNIDERIYNINNCKICIIYNYEEIKNQKDNQNNLTFFINYGLDKKRWKNVDITLIIIITGITEILFPERSDIIIINKQNYGNLNECINFFEKKENILLATHFTHVFLMNSNIFGPIYEDSLDKHWIEPKFNYINDFRL